MPESRLSPELLLCVAAAGALACGGGSSTSPNPPPPPPPPVPNFINLQSDGGDYIGAGLSYSYNQANAVLTVTGSGAILSVRVQGDEGWTGNFTFPAGAAQLRAGTYSGLERFSSDPAKGALDWFGEGRGCNELSGSVTIDSVTYTGAPFTAIDLHFEQHCEKGAPALRGTIHWRSDDATKPPRPVSPVPASLWQPAAGTTPATGTYVYLTSEFGDWVGQAGAYTYIAPNATINVSGNGGHVAVQVGNSTDSWFADFQVMLGLERLEVGYYPGLHRWPFLNPAKGGLQWSGQGRGCNTLTGWFVVDQVAYTNGTLTALDLRFEQHCEGGTPALHGKIHWTA